jgi:prevent-host-death family protein
MIGQARDHPRANSESHQPPSGDAIYNVLWIVMAPKKVLQQVRACSKDIHSLTAFRRRSGEFMKQLRKSKRPVVLTVKGKAAAVVQDAEAYQRLLDIAAQADAGEGIRQGLQDVSEGRVRPAKEFFKEFEARHGIR